MEPIVIEPTKHSPLIEFNLDGKFKLEGRSIPEDVIKLYNPLIDFACNFSCPNLTFEINLEYFNTATSKKLMELFKHIDANNKIENILINWHFEEGDEDSVEMAEIYEESLLRCEFRYLEYAEVN